MTLLQPFLVPFLIKWRCQPVLWVSDSPFVSLTIQRLCTYWEFRYQSNATHIPPQTDADIQRFLPPNTSVLCPHPIFFLSMFIGMYLILFRVKTKGDYIKHTLRLNNTCFAWDHHCQGLKGSLNHLYYSHWPSRHPSLTCSHLPVISLLNVPESSPLNQIQMFKAELLLDERQTPLPSLLGAHISEHSLSSREGCIV